MMKRWAEFVSTQALNKPYIIAGAQGIYPDLEWTFPAHLLLKDKTLTVSNCGYAVPKNENTMPSKMRALHRNYLNQETIDRAASDLDDRLRDKKYGSGVWDFRGEKKKGTKQDYCITAGTIAYYPQHKHTRITINFRTAELIFRHRADLIFLRDYIFPQFDLQTAPPDTLTFRYNNATIHPMFFVLLLIELDKPLRYLRELKDKNPEIYKQVIRWTLIHCEGEYRKYLTAKRIQDYLVKNSKIHGKKLTKIWRYIKREHF